MARITVGRTLHSSTDSATVVQGAAGSAPWPVRDAAQIVPFDYDEMVLSYVGEDLYQVTYKNGGTTVAVLTLTHVAGKLTHVVRT
jgi:hypothetical protein